MNVFYDENTICIQNVAPCWNGKTGVVKQWLHDNWYIVDCEGTELVLDSARGEMTQVEERG